MRRPVTVSPVRTIARQPPQAREIAPELRLGPVQRRADPARRMVARRQACAGCRSRPAARPSRAAAARKPGRRWRGAKRIAGRLGECGKGDGGEGGEREQHSSWRLPMDRVAFASACAWSSQLAERLRRNPSADDRRIAPRRHHASPRLAPLRPPRRPRRGSAAPGRGRCAARRRPRLLRRAPPRPPSAADGFAPMFDAEVVMPLGRPAICVGRDAVVAAFRDSPAFREGRVCLGAGPRRHLGRRHPRLHLRLSHPLRRRSGAARTANISLTGCAAPKAGGSPPTASSPAPPARSRLAMLPPSLPGFAAARAATRPRIAAHQAQPRRRRAAPSPTAPSRSACAPPSANMAARTR